MFVVEAPDVGVGNLSANSPTTLATSSPLETRRHSPSAWIPLALFQSLTYSSIAYDTRGFSCTCLAVVDGGRAQMYRVTPSFTYMKVLACGAPSLDAVASVTVLPSPR